MTLRKAKQQDQKIGGGRVFIRHAMRPVLKRAGRNAFGPYAPAHPRHSYL
ncbi:MAG: hypothetical protein RIR59_744, partial [Pseudomonadota bacterium]